MIDGLADGDLFQKVQRDDGARAAEAEICRRFAPRIRLYGLRHLRAEDRAADLVQDVLLAVLEAARAGRIEDLEHVDRFVLGTCRNIALRQRERAARAQPTDAALLDVVAIHPAYERIDAAALMHCMQKLDVRSRLVVIMSFHEEKAADDIAKTAETTVGNVRVLRHRALAQLRGCLDGARS